VILANELLDNLPFDLFEKGKSGRWCEVRVAPGPDAVLVDASEADAALLDQLCSTASTGTRAPLLRRAGQWVAHRLVDLCSGGRLVVIDYASTTARLSVDYQDEWLRTYRSHGRGTGPLDAPGEQDITVEVCVDQLACAARPPDEQQSQADFLLRWGIDDLVAEGREAWTGRTGPPDLGRSRAIEAEALLDLSGLGAFQVLQWMGR
jgi:SAM-dependent MidA family methyltransferase